MDAGVEATQERLPEPGKRRGGWPLFPSGILPFALQASFAVRAAPAAQWRLSLGRSRESHSRAEGARKPLLQGRSEMGWMAISKRLLPARSSCSKVHSDPSFRWAQACYTLSRLEKIRLTQLAGDMDDAPR